MRRMSVTHNNVFVHSNPPKAVSGSGALIRQWVKNGDVEKLEGLVLEGQGARLLGLMESAGDAKVKVFLRSIPGYMAKVDSIHDAVIRGSLRETQTLVDKKKLASARDAVGRGLAHKAVLYNNRSIIEWLAKKYPETLNLKDNESRTCLHYAAAARDPEETYDILVKLGSNPELVDIHGRKANYYLTHPDELDIEGPARSLSRGKRRRVSPISPPKRKLIVSAPSITRAQIRIWIHEKEIPKLEKIVWSGHGDKLLLETSNNGKVRRFLDNVPHLLSRIKSIHTAAINNDLEGMKEMRQKTELLEVFRAKDAHGLNPLHKAAGLGNRGVLEYLIYEVPDLINETDNEGRTPLHFAAREQGIYSFLIKTGANESTLDQKGRPPSYYQSHPVDLDVRYLRNIPDAPRVSGELSGWDRASPLITSTKRRTSSGEFSQNQAGGKYELSDNIELNEAELRADEIEFQPVVPKSKGHNRNMSRGGGYRAMRSQENERQKSRTEEPNSTMAMPDEPVAMSSGADEEAPEPRDLSPSPADEPRDLSPTPPEESGAISRTNGGGAISRTTNNSRVTSRTDDQQMATSSRAASRTEEPRAVSNTNESRAKSNMNASRAASRTEEQRSDMDIEEPRAVSRTIGSRTSTRAEDARAVSRTEEALAKSRAASRTEDERATSRAASRTEEQRVASRAASRTEENAASGMEESGGTRNVTRNNSKADILSKSAAGSRTVSRDNSRGDLGISRGNSRNDLLEGRKSALERGETFIREAADEVEAEVNNGVENMEATEAAEETLDDQTPMEAEENVRVEEPIERPKSKAVAFEEPMRDTSEAEAEELPPKTPLPRTPQPKTPKPKTPMPKTPLSRSTSKGKIGATTEEGQDIPDEPRDEVIDEIEAALKRGDMESLVERILEGKGGELLNRKTNKPDVQEFLSNVPAYIAKIASIHKAAGSGDLRGLQSLLDRKRLALARDGMGRGPLHYAALNGYTAVARHLASTYPQTLKLLDVNGRSALHYAATLPDSGGMYKYLVNLGADPNVKDADNNTPGIYLRNRELLTHQQLLEEKPVEIPVAATPVERWERPSTPPESTLAALEAFYSATLDKTENLWSRAWRNFTQRGDSNLKELIRKYLDRDMFNMIKRRGIKNGSLLDVIKYYPQFFIVAPCDQAYDVWQELFVPTVVDHARLLGPFTGRTSLLGGTLPEVTIPQVDPPSKFVTLVRVRVSRNLKPFPFLPLLSGVELKNIASIIKAVQLNMPCFDLERCLMEKDVRQELKSRCWVPEATKMSRFWPKHRYIILSHDNAVQVLTNAEDHLDIVVSSKYGKLNPMMETLHGVYALYQQKCVFYENEQFGFLTVDPFRAGTGMKITFRIRLPTLMKEKTELISFCSTHNLSIRWKDNKGIGSNAEIGPEDWIELENNKSLGINELELATDIANAINKLITAEEERTKFLILLEKENAKKIKQ